MKKKLVFNFNVIFFEKNGKRITEKLHVKLRKRFWRQIDRQQFLLMHLAYFRPGIQSLNAGRPGGGSIVVLNYWVKLFHYTSLDGF